jgi:3',5'-cyclic AMP phosphodiesterase CpdA
MSKFWSTGSISSSSSSDSEDEGNADNDWPEKEETQKNSRDALSHDPNLAWDTIKGKQEFIEPLKSSNSKPPDCTRIVCMSDTHGKHREIYLPPGDILIHGGDFTKSGEPGNIRDLDRYFGETNYDEIICIAGNHDMTLHPEFYESNWKRFHNKKFTASGTSFKNCTYLEDASHTTGDGLDVYGSPWSPFFFGWAFNLDRGAPIKAVWDKIPDATDLLITHGPPLGRGDLTADNGRVGCYDLLVAVQERVKPRLHIFG